MKEKEVGKRLETNDKVIQENDKARRKNTEELRIRQETEEGEGEYKLKKY